MAGRTCTATYVFGEESLTTTFPVESHVEVLLSSSEPSIRKNGSDELRKQAARELHRFFVQLQGINIHKIRTRMRMQYGLGAK